MRKLNHFSFKKESEWERGRLRGKAALEDKIK